MKEIKNIDKIYLSKFDIYVEPYLTYAQIQAITNAVCKFDDWADREQNIDILLLHFVTDIGDDKLQEIGHETLIKSGIIDEVKRLVNNFNKIQEAIQYTQSTQRALTQIVKEIPNIKKAIQNGKPNKKSNSIK